MGYPEYIPYPGNSGAITFIDKVNLIWESISLERLISSALPWKKIAYFGHSVFVVASINKQGIWLRPLLAGSSVSYPSSE